MEGLSELLSVVFFASLVIFIIAFLVLGLVMQRQKRNPEYKSKHNWKHITLCSLLTLIASLVLFSFTSSHTPEAKKEATESSSESVKKASIKKVKKDEAKAKSSSVKAKKAADASSNKYWKNKEKKARAKNIQINFRDYKNDLAKLPAKSHNAITDAYYSKTSGGAVIVINDTILTQSDSAVRSTVHNAWKIGQNIYNNNSPLPNSVNYLVSVKDQGGDQLAHTSMFGSFKYDGQ